MILFLPFLRRVFVLLASSVGGFVFRRTRRRTAVLAVRFGHFLVFFMLFLLAMLFSHYSFLLGFSVLLTFGNGRFPATHGGSGTYWTYKHIFKLWVSLFLNLHLFRSSFGRDWSGGRKGGSVCGSVSNQIHSRASISHG